LHIPTSPAEGLLLSACQENGYLAFVPTVKVTLKFIEDGEALKAQVCEVRGLPGTSQERPLELQTDGEGRLELEVPVLVRDLEVFFPDTNATFSVRVGDMDPDAEE